VVDDSEDDYEAMVGAFKKVGLNCPVVWCRSGQDALDSLKRACAQEKPGNDSPGLVLLDLNMPGLDGRKTLQQIKEDTKLKRIPVIVLTTSADERDVKDCYQLGANTYVQKPPNLDGLIEAVGALKAYWFEVAVLC